MNSNSKTEYQENLIENSNVNKEKSHIDRNKTIHDPKYSNYTLNVNTRVQQYIKNEKLHSNKICTSKYNKFNFFPKILWEQFSKTSNIYFLFMAILQLIPQISPTKGFPVMLMPLLFVVAVNGFKDFWEDYKRKVSDNRENKTKCKLVSSGEVMWEELKVGDIVKVHKDEYFPTDLLMLYSTNKNGVAYVETKNIDGETNLKYKESSQKSYKVLKNIRDEEKDEYVNNIFGLISCDSPNANMYEFEGTYYYEDRNDETSLITKTRKSITEIKPTLNVSLTKELSNSLLQFEGKNSLECSDATQVKSCVLNLEYNNILLRGSSLRNTEYVFGIVIYAGHNTKIMLNSLNARTKKSRVFKIMNTQLYFIIIMQLVLCVVFSIFYCNNDDPYDGIWYPINTTGVISSFFYSFIAWLLNTTNIVPISLLVTLEMIKFCQALLITWDYKIYDLENKRNAIVQSSALNEELGMVSHIFTDKTGTLTKNIMQFKYLVVGEHVYGSEMRITNYLF
jgi:phospholipid-transporting ATPase